MRVNHCNSCQTDLAFVETIDEKGATVDIHSIANTQYKQATLRRDRCRRNGLLAIAYASPALDVRQHLKSSSPNQCRRPAGFNQARDSGR